MRIRDNRDIFPPLRPPRPRVPFASRSRRRWRELEARIEQVRRRVIEPVRRRLNMQVEYHTEPVRLWYKGEVLSGKLVTADILIAVSERWVRRQAVNAVRAEGFGAIAANSPMAVLGHMQMTKFRGAVIDMEMPGFPGWRLIRWIRRRFPTVKLIILGPQRPDWIRAAIRMGCFSYLYKPVDMTKLITCIRNILYTRREVCPVEGRGTACDRSCVPEGTDLQRFGREFGPERR